MLAASREEAVLAVKLYNDPTGDRTLEGFVVHMHLAWLYLLQAEWTKAKKDYRIPEKARKGWFKKIEGEYQTPSLEWFVQQTWVDSNPARANIEFFIRLRNKIEHRHSGSKESLAAVISGECHACWSTTRSRLRRWRTGTVAPHCAQASRLRGGLHG